MAALFVLALAARWPYLQLLPHFTDEINEVMTALKISRGQAWPLTAQETYFGPIHLYIIGEQIRGGPVIVAAGHSARDVWSWMLDAGATAELRPIHIGARIEHPQRLIDEGLYGGPRGDLPPATYRFPIQNPRDSR